MCLAVVALDAHPRYALVIAANRDEFHARRAEAAHWWRDGSVVPILAGRDLEQGGTWLGITRAGRWAFVTNVREPGRHDPAAPSRGSLVPNLLRDRRPVVEALAALVGAGLRHNGFNLVGGCGASGAFGSNRGDGPVALARGIHGVSNAGLDTPWPKLQRAKAGVAGWIAAGGDDVAALFGVLADRTMADDQDLPDTGVGRDRERLLSSPFIVSASYGTRCSTLVAIARDGSTQLIERRFDPSGSATGEFACEFMRDRTLAA